MTWDSDGRRFEHRFYSARHVVRSFYGAEEACHDRIVLSDEIAIQIMVCGKRHDGYLSITFLDLEGRPCMFAHWESLEYTIEQPVRLQPSLELPWDVSKQKLDRCGLEVCTLSPTHFLLLVCLRLTCTLTDPGGCQCLSSCQEP